MILLVIACVFVEAIFTAMEVSYGAVTKSRLRLLVDDSETDAENPKKVLFAKRALELSEHKNRLTLLFLTVTCLTMWSAAMLLLWWLYNHEYSVWWIVVALLPVLFIAEVIPLAVASRFSEFIVLRSASFLHFILIITAPLLWIVGGMASAVAYLGGARKESIGKLTEGEVRSAIATAEEEGVLEETERDMLELAMDFRVKLVREVMTPRPDITAIEGSASLEETLQHSFESGHSRLLAYEGSLDKVIGIIAIKDIIPTARRGREKLRQRQVRDIVRPAYFVPEDKHIASTLEEMRRRHTLVAVVVNAEGTTTGIVTEEDLLEELVGEIQDEYDQEEPIFQRVNDEEGEKIGILCDASVMVRDFERHWEQEFEQEIELYSRSGEAADDSISLAALALDLFDGIPRVGAMADAGPQDEAQKMTLTVSEMDGPRIEKVLLQIPVS